MAKAASAKKASIMKWRRRKRRISWRMAKYQLSAKAQHGGRIRKATMLHQYIMAPAWRWRKLLAARSALWQQTIISLQPSALRSAAKGWRGASYWRSGS